MELGQAAEIQIASSEKIATHYRKWLEEHLGRLNDYYERIAFLRKNGSG